MRRSDWRVLRRTKVADDVPALCSRDQPSEG
jgi:hypothetical protein